MPVGVSEETDALGLPLPDASSLVPQSFIEAAHLKYAVKEELAAITVSSSFRTSPKSCEFLRYVVEVTLDGRIDSLKERSIGMDLLGRDASYDPNTDAAVRVRAVEVRKRLNSFYAKQDSVSGYRIELLPGSYMPKFVPVLEKITPHESSSKSNEAAVEQVIVREPEFSIKRLNILKMASPALIALLICALFLRQQIQRGDSYHQFWDKRLHGKSLMLLSVDKLHDLKTSTDDTSQAMFPIVWLAGRYDLKVLMKSQETGKGDRQSELDIDAAIIHLSRTTPPEFAADKRLRYSRTSDQKALQLTDRLNPAGTSASAETALLTLLPERPSELWLTGTDWRAVNALAEIVTSKSDFPSQLNFEAEAGRVVQVSWRSTPSPYLEIYTPQP